MVETLICLPSLMALTALVVEVARLAALSIVLQAATGDAARAVALRWVHIERGGWDRPSRSNEADLAPGLAAAVERDVLAHVGAFPGFTPLARGGMPSPPHGRLYLDKEGNTLTVRVHACVPLLFLSWNSEDALRRTPRSPSDRAPGASGSRDCGGRFRVSTAGVTWRLVASATVELPASASVFRKGLALPAHMPLVNVPSPEVGGFANGASGAALSWDSLFREASDVLTNTDGPGGP